MSPTVSVLTPSFGYGRFISDAIESVLKQNAAEIEHIVQDGASRDDTVEVLGSYGDRIDWRSEPDKGQANALNRAFSRANGEWIAWLNADEFYLPGALSQLVDAGRRSNADVVYGDAVFVNEDGSFMRLLPQHRFSRYVLRSYGPFIPSCSVIFRRESLGSLPWDEQCRRIMDFELYLRLQSEGRHFLYVPVPVGAFRVHEARVTAQPAEPSSEEHATVRHRYGLNGPRQGKLSRGRVAHGLIKFIDGSYARQRRASRSNANDLRWFRGPEQNCAVLTLYRTSYPQLAQ